MDTNPLVSEEKGNRFIYTVGSGHMQHCTYVLMWKFVPTYSSAFLSIYFFKFYLSTVDLQCCVNFCCIAKWFSYTYIILFHILFHYHLSQDTEYSSPCYTVGVCCLSTLYISLHLLIPNSQFIPPPTFLPLIIHKSVLSVCSLLLFFKGWFYFIFNIFIVV